MPAATDAEFRREQRHVAVAMAMALAISLAALALAIWLGGDVPLRSFTDRLQTSLRADAWVIVWLAATIANVARLRFVSEQDIAGAGSSGASDDVRRANAIAQNTLEQVVIAVATHLLVTATFDRSQPIVTALVGLFALGRGLFWVGYARGAAGRALGFGLTFYPSVLALLASIVTLLLR